MSGTHERGISEDSARILLISGSIREPSYTRTLTDQIETTVLEAGASASHWSLCEQPLPIADPRFHHYPAAHTSEQIRKLVALADAADAFVFCTPVYHNSYSGVLKNALDHLSISQFRYKPVGLASHGGNRNTQAVDQLRIVVRGLLGVAIPTQVCTTPEDYIDVDSGDYRLRNAGILGRIVRFTFELTLFARCLRLAREVTTGSRAAVLRRSGDELQQLFG